MATQHTHGIECYQILLSCGYSEHSHTGGCWNKDGSSKCQRLEHSHSSACNQRHGPVCGK